MKESGGRGFDELLNLVPFVTKESHNMKRITLFAFQVEPMLFFSNLKNFPIYFFFILFYFYTFQLST